MSHLRKLPQLINFVSAHQTVTHHITQVDCLSASRSSATEESTPASRTLPGHRPFSLDWLWMLLLCSHPYPVVFAWQTKLFSMSGTVLGVVYPMVLYAAGRVASVSDGSSRVHIGVMTSLEALSGMAVM